MSVMKKDKSISDVRFFTLAQRIKRDIFTICLKDFGIKKWPVKLNLENHEIFSTLTPSVDQVLTTYEIPEWAVKELRKPLLRTSFLIYDYIIKANAVYPTTLEDIILRRRLQNKALGACDSLATHIGFAVEILRTNLKLWDRVLKDLEELIRVLRGWKSSDHAFETRVLKSFADRVRRVDRTAGKDFMRRYDTYQSQRDLKYLMHTDNPELMLSRLHNVIEEICFGITPNIKRLLETSRMQNKDSTDNEKFNGHTYSEWMARDDIFQTTKNPAPPTPKPKVPPPNPKKMDIVINDPSKKKVVYLRDPEEIKEDKIMSTVRAMTIAKQNERNRTFGDTRKTYVKLIQSGEVQKNYVTELAKDTAQEISDLLSLKEGKKIKTVIPQEKLSKKELELIQSSSSDIILTELNVK